LAGLDGGGIRVRGRASGAGGGGEASPHGRNQPRAVTTGRAFLPAGDADLARPAPSAPGHGSATTTACDAVAEVENRRKRRVFPCDRWCGARDAALDVRPRQRDAGPRRRKKVAEMPRFLLVFVYTTRR